MDPNAKDPTKEPFTHITSSGQKIEVPTIITGGYDFDNLLCLFCEKQQFKNDITLINHLLNHFGVAPKTMQKETCVWSSWRISVILAFGKILVADLLEVNGTVKLGLEGPLGPGQGLCRWPLQAPHGKGRGKFQTLWPLASRSRRRARRRAHAPQEPKGIQRFCCIA